MHFHSRWFSFHYIPMGYKYMEKHSCNFFQANGSDFQKFSWTHGKSIFNTLHREKFLKPIYNCMLMKRNSFQTHFKRVHLKIEWSFIPGLFFFTKIMKLTVMTFVLERNTSLYHDYCQIAQYLNDFWIKRKHIVYI